MTSTDASESVGESIGSVQKTVPHRVIVHPLVLLSSVDHYYRVSKDTKKRVVGVLLGEVRKGVVDITNSFAVPFEEDEGSGGIWFLDHNFCENMFAMFKKVNARENIVGWYSSGPRLRAADASIHELFRRYTPQPVLVIIDVTAKEQHHEIPTKAYVAVPPAGSDRAAANSDAAVAFQHVSAEIGALEAEEVGVEHLLRDVKDTAQSSLAQHVRAKLSSLNALESHLREALQYAERVAAGQLPPNSEILALLQDVFNVAPLAAAGSVAVKGNDAMLAIYLSALLRSTVALHSLINNKLEYRLDSEQAAGTTDAKDAKHETSNDTKDASKPTDVK
eukprot:TRINITY_DN6068_c0_g1_i1.p1 TRINITY_DN6068_c0_g1~~TRINITY_DN6068_c0_g1_i1.p1  ORF type:complete len:334 (+),score=98.58 TRINITY_DN6068_c0_g1_i1:74-1075(+)